MAETIFWWVFTAACIFGFLLSYGMVEDLVRQWRADRRSKRATLFLDSVGHNPDPNGNGHFDSLLH